MTNFPDGLIVLLADDDENDVFLIQRWFKRLGQGIRLIVVPDGQDAVAYLQGQRPYADRSQWPLPDLLILDQRMARLSGLEVLQWLRVENQFSTLPVVLMSGGLSPTTLDSVRQLGAAYCRKTVCAGELTPTLEQGMRTALRMSWATDASSRTFALFRDRDVTPPACLGSMVTDSTNARRDWAE